MFQPTSRVARAFASATSAARALTLPQRSRPFSSFGPSRSPSLDQEFDSFFAAAAPSGTRSIAAAATAPAPATVHCATPIAPTRRWWPAVEDEPKASAQSTTSHCNNATADDLFAAWDEVAAPPARQLFVATQHWQQVQPYHILPAGLVIKVDMSIDSRDSGGMVARLPPS